tara:strand:+ start:583 stop:2010 length:1428 start_codon:yes stop_codon:yes gene_type:complete
MSVRDLDKDLQEIFDITVGKDGDKRVIRVLRRILNRAESRVTVDSKLFSSDLRAQYKQRTGKEPQAKVMEGYANLGKDIVKGWDNKVKTDKSMTLVSSTSTKIIFVIQEKEGAKKGTLRDNFNLFRKENQKIVQPLIKSKYHHLFRGRTRTKSGNIRAIADVGHDYSVTEKGRGGVAAGMLDNLLAGDFADPNDRDKVQKIRDGLTTVGLKATEVLKVTGSGAMMRSSTIISLSLESDTSNRSKQDEDKKAGEEIRGYLKDALSKTKGNLSTGAKYVNKQGSTPFIDQVGEAIVNTPLKMAMYQKRKAKNLSKYKTPIKNTVTEKKASKSRQIKGQRNNITGGGVDSTMIAAITKGAREEGKPDKKDFAHKIRNLLKVKRAINARLPAEIRRNMGKPALTNRTGRFSNSAEVTSILPAAQTLMVKYTYRLNPYETFENTGSKKWPTGYNPKPLIAKSIRGLALGLIDAKLTLRRE